MVNFHILYSGSNSELDMYGCLVENLEPKVGCKIERDLTDFHSNATFTKHGYCLDFSDVVQETLGQVDWLEDELASHGCVPSCQRETFYIKEVTQSFMNNEELRSFQRDEGAKRKLRWV